MRRKVEHWASRHHGSGSHAQREIRRPREDAPRCRLTPADALSLAAWTEEGRQGVHSDPIRRLHEELQEALPQPARTGGVHYKRHRRDPPPTPARSPQCSNHEKLRRERRLS